MLGYMIILVKLISAYICSFDQLIATWSKYLLNLLKYLLNLSVTIKNLIPWTCFVLILVQ
jgi:hypothetical protein